MSSTLQFVVSVLSVFSFVIFAVTGSIKLFTPMESLERIMPWVATAPSGSARFIGAAEVLGALGLILPGLTGVMAWLMPSAAIGLMLIMIGATGHHLRHHEIGRSLVPFVLLVVNAFVAVTRVLYL